MAKIPAPTPKEVSPRKEYEQILELVKLYNLELHDPQLSLLLRSYTPDDQSKLGQHLWQEIKSRVSAYVAYHQQNPFPTTPAELFQDGYILGRQKANSSFIRITDEQLSRHALIVSASGSGKTTFSHLLMHQLLQAGKKIIIIDPKEDSPLFPVLHPEFLILDEDAPLNLLQVPAYLSLPEFFAIFTACFARAFYGGEHVKQILNEGLRRVFSATSTPSLKDLSKTIQLMYNIKDTYARRDAIQGVLQRLARIEQQYPAMFQCRIGISFDELFRHSLYLPVKMMDEVQEFIDSFIVHQLYFQNRAKKKRDILDMIIYLDEGLLSWNKNQPKIEGTPLLSYLQSMVREFGIAVWVTSTSISQIDQLLKSNVYLQVCMNLSTSQEVEEVSRTFGLNPEQKQYLHKQITKGEAIIKFSDGWKEPILATFPPLPYSKDIPHEQYHEAKQRILKFVPAQQVPLEVQEPKPSSHDIGEVEPEPKEPKQPVLQLSDKEKMILNSIATSLQPATTHYKKLGLHAATGNKIKKHLLTLQLVTEETILVRAGKGSSANVLFPTDNAFKFLGLKRPAGTKGGDSPQHQYLVRSLADLIPESQIEFKLGSKSMDLFLCLKPDLHQPLREAVKDSIIFYIADKDNEHLDIFYIETNYPASNYVAIEIECSNPEKTGPANIQKNAEAGIAFTILGLLPAEAKKFNPRLITGLPEALQRKVAVVDALKLLDQLRERYERRGIS